MNYKPNKKEREALEAMVDFGALHVSKSDWVEEAAARRLAKHGFARKAWFKSVYYPTKEGKILHIMCAIDNLHEMVKTRQ